MKCRGYTLIEVVIVATLFLIALAILGVAGFIIHLCAR